MTNELKHFMSVWINAVCGIRAENKVGKEIKEMTKEELAEEYANKEWTPFRFYDAGCDVYNDDIREDVKQAFLAGLKAGKDMAEADLVTVAYMQGATQQKKKAENQLIKAKEIIKALLKHTHGQNLNTQNDFDLYLGRIKEAEQFLKEIEK